MKKILFSDDSTVTKIVHEDDSETAIKTVSSCDTCINEDGTFLLNETDRNKYSIFVSDSAGCFMKCKFCYLTLKNMKYKKLSYVDIVTNIKEALDERTKAAEFGTVEKVLDKYVKLCWMGMGDAFINSERVVDATYDILTHILNSDARHARGLDGVDLSTVMPNVKNLDETFENFLLLEELLKQFPLNPHNDVIVHRNAEFSNTGTMYPDRSRFRLFYSLHSALQETREELIPNAMPMHNAIPALLEYSEDNKHNVIFHHMFIDGFNDSQEEIDALISLIRVYSLQDYEFRILRYNTCDVTTFIHESDNFKNIIKQLVTVHPHIKVQVSAGSEVQAACGQFLTNM